LIIKDGKPLLGRFLGKDNPRLFTRIYGDEPTVRPEIAKKHDFFETASQPNCGSPIDEADSS
jgi:hypothetical protein